jgi:hypothetical protein
MAIQTKEMIAYNILKVKFIRASDDKSKNPLAWRFLLDSA